MWIQVLKIVVQRVVQMTEAEPWSLWSSRRGQEQIYCTRKAQFWPREEDGCVGLEQRSWFSPFCHNFPPGPKNDNMWHSPRGPELGQTPDLQQAMEHHFQTQVGCCGILNKWSSPSVICQFMSAAAQMKSPLIQGYKWGSGRKEDRQW